MSAVWLTRSLGEVVAITKGRKPPRLIADSSGDSLPYATADYFRSGIATQFVPSADLASCVLTKKGCPVLIWDGSNAGEVFVGKDAVLASTMALIRPDDSVLDEGFCYFFLKTAFDKLNDGTTGSTIPHVSKHMLAALQIPILPLSEQRLISSLLFKLESAIAVQAQLTDATAELKRAAMRELFTRGLRGEPQKDTDIGPVPESWSVGCFSDVREWLQYGVSVHCTLQKKSYPVLRIPNVEPGKVNDAELKYCDLSNKEASKYLLQNGDLLFIRTNAVLERLGSCAVYDGQPQNALFASYLIRARLKPDIDPRFVAYFYASSLGTSLVSGRATPAADGKYNLNTGTIDSLPLPLPPTLNEQREIVAILDAIDRKIELHRRKKQVLEELFKAMLHKLMTGEIRVADLDLSALDPSPTSSVTA